MYKFILLVITIAICFLTYGFIRFYFDIQKGTRLANKAKPFERALESPEIRILVIGDSTGLGTGASSPSKSLAGRLAERYPEASIQNESDNGAKLKDIQNQLADTEDQFDLLFIHGGGNDVIRNTKKDQFEIQLNTLLKEASKKGTLHYHDKFRRYWNSPYLPLPAQLVLHNTHKKIQNNYIEYRSAIPSRSIC